MRPLERSGVGKMAEKPASECSSRALSINVAGIPIPLRRTFGALDRLLAIPIEALGDTLERKMKANVDQHVEAIQKSRKRKGKQEMLKEPSPKNNSSDGGMGVSAG